MYSKNDVSQLQEKPKFIQNEQVIHMLELFTFHEKLLTHPVQCCLMIVSLMSHET